MTELTEPNMSIQSENRTDSLIVPTWSVVVALAGLAGAWIAAGSTGLLGNPLRHAMIWISLGTAIIAAWRPALSIRRIIILLAGVAIAIVMTISVLPVVNVMAVTLVLTTIAISQSGVDKRVILLTAIATMIFGIYKLVSTSIPLVWLVADWLGGLIGRIAGDITGEPLWVGATFAGIDFLVLMVALYAGWLVNTQPPRRTRAIYGALAILTGHVLYLIVLTFVPQILDRFPKPSLDADWSWSAIIHMLVPWNLPILVGIIHMIIAIAMFRWSKWLKTTPLSGQMVRPVISIVTVAILTVILPMLTTLCLNRSDLKGKKIVVYEKGFLNWFKPVHDEYGRLSIGMYGMLPIYVESLGADCVISHDLSKQDIEDADILILLYPDEFWVDGQLERIWNFVRAGGSLLVLGEHTTRDSHGNNRFNEVLAPSAMQVRFDSAKFEIGGWLQSYQALSHPITLGIPDDYNQFGVVIGASVQADWPARPILIGKWGWTDFGDEGNDRAMLGNYCYDSGEKLGDIILVAEQQIGAGKLMAFGDTSTMTNGINVNVHLFTSRLLGYLANGADNPQSTWRGLIALIVVLLLLILLKLRGNEWHLIIVSIVIATSLFVCTKISYQSAEVLPDGRNKSPNNLAYIDSSHIGNYSMETWRKDGIGGLEMTLMRNGYLTLTLPEFDPERIKQAGLLVSIAPSRKFSRSERTTIREFVKNGGIFICMVGYPERRGSELLLSEFGFHVGEAPLDLDKQIQEPLPMGYFKSPFLRNKEQMVYTRFHSAWPVQCSDPKANVIVYGYNNLPVIIMRPFGNGKIVVIGDTNFALNKNLENEGGEPFEGKYENADFWRWFLTYLRDQHQWIPSELQIETVPEGREMAQ